MRCVEKPRFSRSLLHPRYWTVWLSFLLLAIVVNVLPFFVLKWIGYAIGMLAKPLIKKRVNVAKTNLKLCFPQFNHKTRTKILNDNVKNSGLAIIETGMAWFWPDWRVKLHSEVYDKERIIEQELNGKGVLVICCHFLNLEMTARIFSTFSPGYGVYRPHSNKAYEFIQHRGRTRKGHKMIHRDDVMSMIRVLKGGNRLWYLADHDYGSDNSVFAPFFAVEQAATVKGTSFLVDMTDCAVTAASSIRTGSIYSLEVGHDISHQLPRRDVMKVATTVNEEIERTILKGVEQWMWMHKRFKSRPEESPTSLYLQ